VKTPEHNVIATNMLLNYKS